MMLLNHWVREDGSEGWWFWCVGCRSAHSYTTKRGTTYPNSPLWTFNSDAQKPSFSPSLLIYYDRPAIVPDELRSETYKRWRAGEQVAMERKTECHLFVTNGELVYCNDCPHPLAGKTVPLDDLENHRDYGGIW